MRMTHIFRKKDHNEFSVIYVVMSRKKPEPDFNPERIQ